MATNNLHVGIIMDGNGRWASLKNKPRSYGHLKGAENVEKIVYSAIKKGVKTLTLFAFSCENWSRPTAEIQELFNYIKDFLNSYVKKFLTKGIRVNVIGDLSKFDSNFNSVINHLQDLSKENSDFTLNIALNYGGRQEIVNAVNKLIKSNQEISVEGISKNLYTYECGEPDLIIRTGGEYRLSNFLTFQSAYSELYFTDVLWPDFSEEDLEKAIFEYNNRQRRFGGI